MKRAVRVQPLLHSVSEVRPIRLPLPSPSSISGHRPLAVLFVVAHIANLRDKSEIVAFSLDPYRRRLFQLVGHGVVPDAEDGQQDVNNSTFERSNEKNPSSTTYLLLSV